MAELKTKKNDASVEAFLQTLADEQQRTDSQQIIAMMQEITGAVPKMWGTAIIGFGDYRYKYESGREGDWFQVGFAPRKANISLYITNCIEQFSPLLEKLGKHKIGKGCLYIKRLEDIDTSVLKQMLKAAVKQFKSKKQS